MLSAIRDFVNWVRRRNPQARTWRDYSYDLRQFTAVVGDRPPAEITHHDIDRFVNSQVANGFKPATVNRRLAAVLALFTYLADEDPALICPILPRPVKEADLRAFFTVIEDSRDQAMFILMLRCGLRISEVANLLRSDIFLDEPAPRLVVHGKGSRERSVYLSPQAEHALRIYLKNRPTTTSDHVFLSYLGEGLSTTAIHKRLMRYRQQAQVSLTCHRLRHSFANDLLSAGAPVTSIQALLGHRWLETTQIYVQANDRQVQEDYYAACLKLEGWALPQAAP